VSHKSLSILQKVTVPSLGIKITPVSAQELLPFLRYPQKRALYVGHNLHSVYLFHTDPIFAKVYEGATVILIDGQPVRWFANLNAAPEGPFPSTTRVGTMDWLPLAGNSWDVSRLAVVGANEKSNARTVSLLQRAMQGEVRGWHGQDWTDNRARKVAREVGEFSPDLVLVGLGMPLQEHFYERHLRLQCSAAVALVGGAIDQLNGSEHQAPRVVRQAGLEWLWRLAQNPRRLARRYLVEPFLLARILLSRSDMK
jgi:N-acetylglucosaminyldiphosphoundecaprenol N-acetyl-beta-D-mannosaminyltransferase